MALDELHERRLATLMNVFEDALDRIELLATAAQQEPVDDGKPPPTPGQVSEICTAVRKIRRRLELGTLRFGVKRARPGWRQEIAAELSTLWVVLEDAMPHRMRGYGREFEPQDRLDWECLIRDLLQEIDGMRDARPQRKANL
jgi:hypothetical protein